MCLSKIIWATYNSPVGALRHIAYFASPSKMLIYGFVRTIRCILDPQTSPQNMAHHRLEITSEAVNLFPVVKQYHEIITQIKKNFLILHLVVN